MYKLVCDNECGTEAQIDRYFEFIDENTAPWYAVKREEVTKENEETGEFDVVYSEINLQFCSPECMVRWFNKQKM